MKALLIKDLLTVRQNGKYYLLLCIIYLVIGLMMDNIMIGAGLFTMMGAVMSLSFFSYDDMAKWDNFALTLPVTRKNIVSARYTAGLVLLGIGLAVSFLMWGTMALVSASEALRADVVLSSFVGVVGAALLLMAVLFPLCYRYGVERARIAIAMIFLIPAALIALGSRLGFQAPEERTVILLIRIGIAAAVLLYWLSWKISVEIYENKEL